MYKMDRFNRKKDYFKYVLPWGRIFTMSEVNPDTAPAFLVNKDGSLQCTWSYRGPDLASSVKEQLAVITQQLSTAFQSMDSGWVFYFEAQRIASTAYPKDVYFPDKITETMDLERRQFFSGGSHFESNYYMTAYWMPPSDNEGRLREFVVEGKKKKKHSADDNIITFTQMIDKLVALLTTLGIPSAILNRHELVTYLHSCISDNPKPLRVPSHPLILDHYLCDVPFYGGLEPRLGKKHIRVVSPISYVNNTFFGMFDAINQLDFSYRWVTRFVCLGKQDCLAALEEKKKGWYGKKKPLMAMLKELVLNQPVLEDSVNENAAMKYGETREAITLVESDVLGYGFYSSCVVVMNEDPIQADTFAQAIEATFINKGIKAKVEDLNSVDTFFGTFPGNIGRFVRKPLISTGNLIHMMPISDIWAGNPRNKHLQGPPLLYTQTTGRTPFRLSLHVGDVGHTLIAGPTGAGKSVLLNTMAAAFRKYKNSRIIIFDKGASSMELTYGVGGKFFDLGNESDGGLSFMPLAYVDDEKERQWAQDWLVDYLVQENFEVKPLHKKLIWDALTTLGSYEQIGLRRMTNFVNAVQDLELRQAFEPLTIKGAYGGIFDSNEDHLSITSWQSFEMEKLMSTKHIVGPALMYIFHRIEQSLDGSPTMIVLDECWVFFDNELFVQKIREWLKVLRKANASVVFATQSVSDIVNSPIFECVLESCPSQIFLPNDKALEDQAMENYGKFGLNKRQIYIIAQAQMKRQYYFVSPEGCRLFDLALEACPLTLAYVATNKADHQMAQRIINNYGIENFNEHWLNYRNLSLPEVDLSKDRRSFA